MLLLIFFSIVYPVNACIWNPDDKEIKKQKNNSSAFMDALKLDYLPACPPAFLPACLPTFILKPLHHLI